MAYIKKRTTMILFMLLLASIIILAFSVYYFEKSFGKLNVVINDKEDRIYELADEISSLNANLTKVLGTLDIQIKREENLTNLYGQLKSEKEKVEAQKASLSGQLNDTKAELFDARLEVNSLEDDLASQLKKYSDLNKSYEAVLDDVNDVCDKVSTQNITECKKYN